MRQEKNLARPSVRCPVSVRQSRQYLFALITASVPFLVSCGSVKKATQAEVKHQTSTDVQSGVILDFTSQEGPTVEESPELTLPVSALDALPEGAEFSRQDGNTRVSARRTKGDSVKIRATSLRSPPPYIGLKVGASAKAETADTTGAKAKADDTPLPRGQPSKNDKGELLFICVIFLLLIGMIAFESHKHQKQ